MIVLLLLAAALQSVPAARCKKTFVAGSESQFVGRATWQDEPQNTIVASTEDRTVGRSILTCSVKLPAKSNAAVLDFGGARITFEGKDAVGGLEIAVWAPIPHAGFPAVESRVRIGWNSARPSTDWNSNNPSTV